MKLVQYIHTKSNTKSKAIPVSRSVGSYLERAVFEIHWISIAAASFVMITGQGYSGPPAL